MRVSNRGGRKNGSGIHGAGGWWGETGTAKEPQQAEYCRNPKQAIPTKKWRKTPRQTKTDTSGNRRQWAQHPGQNWATRPANHFSKIHQTPTLHKHVENHAKGQYLGYLHFARVWRVRFQDIHAGVFEYAVLGCGRGREQASFASMNPATSSTHKQAKGQNWRTNHTNQTRIRDAATAYTNNTAFNQTLSNRC